MKKIILFLIVAFFFMRCSRTMKNQYSGYIYCDSLPLKKVKILEESTNNYTYSDEKGFFSLNRIYLNSVSNLIMSKGSNIDTIKIRSGGAAGSSFYYRFLYVDIDDTPIARIYSHVTIARICNPCPQS